MTAVKWAIFMVAVAASYSAGAWLRRREAWYLRAWTVVGFLPFFRSLDMALVSWWTPGDTHGIEVTAIDWLALSLLLARRPRAEPAPHRVPMAIYFAVALLCVAQAQWPLGAFGYVWKLGRMYVLYAAIWRAPGDERVPTAILRGAMFGILYECGWTLWQRFGLGVPRAMGTFDHGNTLGMLVNLVVMVPIAAILAGRATRLMKIAVVAAIPAILFTVSRGAIMFLGVGTALLYFAYAYRRPDARMARIGVAGFLLAAALIPLALATVASRSQAEQATSMETRRGFARAASMMVAEHPLGVGPNHFAVMLGVGGYGARAGLAWRERFALVHNVYWLTAAEMGYAGVAALLALFLSPLLSAVRWSFRAHRDRRADVLLGLAVGLAVFYAQSFFEWAWRITEVMYVYWMVVGVAGTLSRQLRSAPVRRRLRPRERPVAFDDVRAGGAATLARS